LTGQWLGLFRFCVLRLNLTPESFWRLSLPELEALIGAFVQDGAAAPVSRSRLNEMLHRYPDTKPNQKAP